MKKLFFVLAAVAAMTFAACEETPKTENADVQEQPAEQAETPAATTEEAAPAANEEAAPAANEEAAPAANEEAAAPQEEKKAE